MSVGTVHNVVCEWNIWRDIVLIDSISVKYGLVQGALALIRLREECVGIVTKISHGYVSKTYSTGHASPVTICPTLCNLRYEGHAVLLGTFGNA